MTTDNLVLSIHLGKLPRNLLRSVWTRVIYHNDLPCQVAIPPSAFPASVEQCSSILFVERLCEKPDDDREVFAFVVGRKDDRVLVGVCAVELALHVQRGDAFKGVHAINTLVILTTRRDVSSQLIFLPLHVTPSPIMHHVFSPCCPSKSSSTRCPFHTCHYKTPVSSTSAHSCLHHGWPHLYRHFCRH